MTLLPIVERELRVRARQGPTYWIRTALAAFAIFICLEQLSYADVLSGAGSPGQITFRGMAVMAFTVCCFGLLATSDAISRERREMTLGLLVLTSVKCGDVLAGKLLSALLLLATVLLAFVPVLMVPVLAGGVTGGEAIQTALVLANTLFLSLALGLQASARRVEWFKAFRAALFWMLGWLFLPMVLDRLFRLDNVISLFSPVAGMSLASQNKAGLGWISIGLGQLIAWGALISAWFAMKHATRDAATEAVAAQGKKLSSEAVVSRSGRETIAQTSADPLAWLLRRQRGVRGMIWIATGLSLASYVVGPLLSWFGGAVPMWLFVWPVMISLTVVVGALLAWAVSRFFFEARRSGELEMLLTTPLGAERMILAHWAFLKRLLRWPVVVLSLVILVQSVFWLWYGRGLIGYGSIQAISTLTSLLAMILSIVALCWTGMWFGLRARSQLLAVVQTVGLIKLVPYLFWFLWSALMRPLINYPGSAAGMVQIVISLVPNLFVAMFFIVVIVRMRRRLLAANFVVRNPGESPSSWPFLKGRTFGSWIQQIRHWTPSS